jgi:hypothetical protein
METTPTESRSNTNDSSNDLHKVIHSFVFGGEVPSKETENRATFLKAFLAEYYKTALQGPYCPSISNPESNAPSCNTTTTTCSINSSCNASNTEVNTCNNTRDDKDNAEGNTRTTTTEHPNLFNSLNSTDEAERLNSLRDMASKLAEKLGGMYKGLTGSKGDPPAVASSNLVNHVLQAAESRNKEVGDLSQHLQLFVDNINESLHLLGTTDLTAEELKLLLAAAPLPSIGNTNPVSEAHISQRPRSRSAGEILSKTASPKNLASRRLRHSVSDGVRPFTKDPSKLSLVASPISEQCEDNNDNITNPTSEGGNNGGVVTRLRSCSVDSDGSVAREQLSSAEGTPTGTPARSKKRLSSFFTKKMESFTNLLDNIEFAERDDTVKVFSKSKSFNLGTRSGTSTPTKSGYGTPTKSGYGTPRSGYGTPRSGSTTPGKEGEGEELNMAALKQKLELVEKALCDEVVVRTEAEEKVAQRGDLISRLKADLDRVQSQKDTVAVINKQMGVELRFLRASNSRFTRDRQQWEDALVGETKKRRTLEEQMQMLIKSYQERNTNGVPKDGELTNKQQEEVFSKQREEVLLAVIESLREQLQTADREIERARHEWQEERARYQETHDLLRFHIDQLTLTRQSAAGKESELNEEVEEVLRDRDVPKSRQLKHQVSVHDLREQPEAEAITKKEPEKPVTERMKVFFLSSSWWPKFDFMNNNSAAQPTRPPVLLLQIAWWISELREYAQTHQDSMRLLVGGHNQFCACDQCVSKATMSGL